jgi:hypothetical protein
MTSTIPAVLLTALMPVTARAQSSFSTGSGITYQGMLQVVYNLVSTFLELAGVAAVLAIVFLALKMAWSRGDTKAYDAARGQLTNVGIGALIIFGAFTIVKTVQYFVNVLGGKQGL